MKRLELAVESLLLASRWLLVVFYLGLALALAVYALTFAKKLYAFMLSALTALPSLALLVWLQRRGHFIGLAKPARVAADE